MTTLWGVSFDATPISGVVVEFVKTARIFHDRGYRVLLDLGYDIKADKHAFHRPYRDESRLFPDWLELARVDGLDRIPGYHEAFVADVLDDLVRRGDPVRSAEVDAVTAALAEAIVAAWEEHDVTAVLVENGTLPENVAYTRALRRAVEEYGQRRGLGRYVLWRDHDLMWQSEPSSGKYGTDPWPAVDPPTDSPYLHHLVLHDEALRRTRQWAPQLTAIDVLPNTFSHDRATVTPGNRDFRRDHGIPDDVPLIARCTRIIPQKRIDRDLHLIAALPDAWLFVAGDPTESPAEHRRLTGLAADLGVTDRVVFGGRLAPYDAEDPAGWSVRDLLAHATVVSFLTSYDYESYGNPIGEAIAAGVPYLTTRYALYDTVYGGKGFRAPVLAAAADLPTAAFVAEVAALLRDPDARAEVAESNHRLSLRHFDRGQAERLLDRLLLRPMNPRTTLSVVLPVWNEAANLPAVLDSLAHQRGPDGAPLDHAGYEVVLVDNNSTDDTRAVARAFAAAHPTFQLEIITEPEQGVSCARRAGMVFASQRSRGRPAGDEPFHLVSADADCRVDPDWLGELAAGMRETKAAIGVCDYYYSAAHFASRPRLWDAISRTLRCRAVTFAIFGGFPDGKGFAVDRDAHDRVGGIEIFYQLRDGRFVNHLSDDWDFGIRVAAAGEDIAYLPRSRVEINPRRVDHAIDEVITGRAYGANGTIVMRDIRPDAGDVEPAEPVDLTEDEARQAWEFSIKDFTPKNTILPVLLRPARLAEEPVREFFGPDLADRLGRRIAEILDEMRVTDLSPIHAYKTPAYRLYFEFADEIFARLRATVGEDIGYPPPLPPCLAEVPPERFREFVRYYCEDRESGEAHNYFGNGGVF
ncbi:glycosyltransferase [Micromonospora cathayae]|uniref:Glycosyltransferase n=1 Tax=Micromonospora cathayae TaxID=3028804 RepID=A0ABY7ZK76_9ACTN|nr:glycosyltransferase [Micromonospora sp. HUAS 3]WDZ83390.1 glycosyltransferase [Micromonospora sp. HUAS 3]